MRMLSPLRLRARVSTLTSLFVVTTLSELLVLALDYVNLGKHALRSLASSPFSSTLFHIW